MSKAAKRSLELYRKEAVQAAKAKMKSAGSCIRQDVTGKFFYFKSLNLQT